MADVLKKPIVFVGMMGSGKSHVGRSLSARLNVPFYDADTILEQEQGQSISDIFSTKGEGAFRAIEKELILRLLDSTQCVISTGGGAVTTPELLQAIKQKSVSIWLQSSVDKIIPRVVNDTNRPLLQCGDPKSKLEGLMQARQPLYEQADIHVLNEDISVESLVDKIVHTLDDFL